MPLVIILDILPVLGWYIDVILLPLNVVFAQIFVHIGWDKDCRMACTKTFPNTRLSVKPIQPNGTLWQMQPYVLTREWVKRVS